MEQLITNIFLRVGLPNGVQQAELRNDLLLGGVRVSVTLFLVWDTKEVQIGGCDYNWDLKDTTSVLKRGS